MSPKNLTLAITLAISAIPSFAPADVVVRKDGKTLHGKILSVDDKLLVLEMNDSGVALKMKFARSDIDSFERDAVFYAARLTGHAGGDLSADSVSQALANARKKGASHLLLVMNLSGGSIAEARKIADALRAVKDLEVVGYVEQLSGAGAIAGLGCKRLVMANFGSIEGEIFQDDKDAAEFATAARDIIAATGRPPMLARALTDSTIAISLATDGEKQSVVEGETDHTRLLRRKNEALRLSANDAVASGFAVGSASDLRNVGKALGLSGWRSYNESGVIKSELAPPPSARFDSGARSSPTTPVSTGTSRSSGSAPVKDSAGAEERYRQEIDRIEKDHNLAMTAIQKQYALNPAARRQAELTEDKNYTDRKDAARRTYDASR